MKPVLQYIIARLKEPTTYGGLAVLLAAYHISAVQANAIIAVCVAVGGLLSVFLPEGSPPK